MNIAKKIIIAISTFLYIGYLPLIPGTFGSIAGLFLFYLTRAHIAAYILTTFSVLILGFLVSTKAEKILGRKDAPCIVIDEVGGMLVALFFIPYDTGLIISAFLVFRILDTLKPYPASLLENLKGSIGIMSDDIIAGLYTGIVIQDVLKLLSFRLS